MDFNFDTGAISGGLQSLDVTTLPPLGGTVGVLTLVGDGAITLLQGGTLARPSSAVGGMFRYNTDLTQLEYFDGTSWQQLSFAGGAVSTFQTSLDGLTPSTPTTGAVTLAGTLGPLSGGTGSSTAPTSGQFLYSSGGTTYAPATLSSFAVTTFSAGTTGLTPSTPTSGAITLGGTLSLSNGGTNASLTGIAGAPVYSTSTAFALGTAGTAGQAYISGGSGAPTWRNVSSDISTDTSAILAGDGSGAFIASGGTFQGSATYSGVTLNGVITNATDAVTKQYVDAMAAGLSWKQAVKAATTGPGTLATDFEAGDTLDTTYTLVAGDRILIKNQTTQSENGIYIVQATGAPVRASDMDATTPINEVNGAAVFVEQGTVNADTAWVQTANVTTIGTDPIVFSQFSGQGTYLAGTGLTLTGNVFSLTSPVAVTLGGTGLTTVPTNGQLLIGNGSGYTLSTLTDGTGITITEGAGSITIDNAGVLSLTGTTNEVEVSASTGNITIGLPNDVTISNTLTVSGLTPNGALYAGAGGLVSSTPALTDGQILIGDTGNTPVAGTITGGTGITVTNGAGTITIDVDSTEVVTSFSAGTTGLTPSTPTSGAVTLAGTLATTNGGTGLTTIGSADQFLSVNGTATGLEYKTISAGTGISVTPGANVLTITNTGVTGFSLNDTSTTPIFTTTPTTTATGSVAATIDLNAQNANLVFAGPATGGAAEPTFRTLVYADIAGTGAALQLYAENAVTPTAPSATGTNAVAIGSSSTATAEDGFAVGDGSAARIIGMKAFANGQFSTTPGSAQHGIYVVRNETTDNTLTELFLNGTSEQIIVPDNALFTFDIMVAGRRTDAVGGGAGYRFVGVVKKDTTAGSVTFVGTPSKTVIGETNGPWDAAVSVDTTTGAFRVRVNGENAKTIRWVATVQTTEVTN